LPLLLPLGKHIPLLLMRRLRTSAPNLTLPLREVSISSIQTFNELRSLQNSSRAVELNDEMKGNKSMFNVQCSMFNVQLKGNGECKDAGCDIVRFSMRARRSPLFQLPVLLFSPIRPAGFLFYVLFFPSLAGGNVPR
jgi:hypothetical protein